MYAHKFDILTKVCILCPTYCPVATDIMMVDNELDLFLVVESNFLLMYYFLGILFLLHFCHFERTYNYHREKIVINETQKQNPISIQNF